jgi:hypothetical protein
LILNTSKKESNFLQVAFQVLTAASFKKAAFWVAQQCSLVKYNDVSGVLAASIIRA